MKIVIKPKFVSEIIPPEFRKYSVEIGDIKDKGKATLAGALPCVLKVRYQRPLIQPNPKTNPLLASSKYEVMYNVININTDPVDPACKPYLRG
tara:strand:- start:341 stop:619 length:279 start_codon:yes stop_codon:yes gene_type:complete